MTTSNQTWLNASETNRKLFAEESLIVDAAEEIWAAMERKGVSKTDLAALLGTSKANITQLLSGSRNMTLRTLADISFYLGQRVSLKVCEPLEVDNAWEQEGHIALGMQYILQAPTEDMAANDAWHMQELLAV